MLKNLSIDNYALIAHLDLSLSPGFTVLTGETGAGKSIIMGALSLILGGRADSKSVRTGATKCVVEGTFDISHYGLQEFFSEGDLEYDPDSTIIRREIYATGKSRAFVNDIPVQLSTLKSLGDRLIDIHSQHQNLLLGQDAFQQQVIDTLAHDAYELGQYRSQYKALMEIRGRIAALQAEAQRSAQEADYMRYQFAQLEEANLQADEQPDLESEQELLSHAEDIKSGLSDIAGALEGEDDDLVSSLSSLAHHAHQLESIYPDIHELAERLESDAIDLRDIAQDIASRAESINFDPRRFEEVETRLNLIYSLQKKHNVDSIASLIAIRDDLDTRLQNLDNSDALIEELRAQELQIKNQTQQCATALSAARRKTASDFQKALAEKVAYLGMPNVKFEVRISPLKDFSPTGIDQITFLFSANKNQPLKSIAEVASGGEISRLMLSIKALVASAKTLPTIIFDEIDTGVSGPTADRMGEIMAEISDSIQVVTITHLPQVAAKGDTHYYIYKEDTADDTQTHISALDSEARIREIARLLSGSTLTPEALANAQALLSVKK